MKLLKAVKDVFNYIKDNIELKIRVCIGIILGEFTVIGLFGILLRFNSSEKTTYLIITLYMIVVSLFVILFGYIYEKGTSKKEE